MEFTSENERLERINNAHLALIGYMGRTIRDKDTEIAALKDQLRAKPAHGQELEEEIEARDRAIRGLHEQITWLNNRNRQDRDELGAEVKRLEARVKELQAEVAERDQSAPKLIADLSIENGKLAVESQRYKNEARDLRAEIERLKEELKAAQDGGPDYGFSMDGVVKWKPATDDKPGPTQYIPMSKMASTDDTSLLRDMDAEIAKNMQANRALDKSAVRKVLADGRKISPIRTAARRAMAIEERRLEGKA